MTLAPDLREADWQHAVQALLPRGLVWPRDADSTLGRFCRALARVLAALHARTRDLTERESFPADTIEMLADWERAFGLPDPCTPADPDTATRRAALLAKVIAQGGQSRAYFMAVAAALGFAITITEFRPFRAGRSVAGDPVFDPDWIFRWRVNAPSISLRYFRAGRSVAGDPLASADNATLECVLGRLKPARTTLVFAYGG